MSEARAGNIRLGTESAGVFAAVEVPADLAQTSVARQVAAAVGAAADFDIDSIADVKMAVDEAVNTAVTRSRADARIHVEMRAAGDTLSVAVEAPVASEKPVDRTSFGWMVLAALAADVSASVEDSDDGPRLRMSLTIRAVRDIS